MSAHCPKCRQPREDDEVYVCCAATTVAWRCTACDKVSEGFARPYGQCPHCGGALTLADATRPAESEEITAVREAFAIELGGQAFYTRAARVATEASMKDLFRRLAAMEADHLQTLARRYHTDVAAPDGGLEAERAAIYAGIDRRPDDPCDLLRIAIACEERAVAFFTERAAAARKSSAVRRLYRELAAEEREHAALLTTEYALWQGGRSGLL
jgi:glutamate synthase (NADPH/NADH) small chain